MISAYNSLITYNGSEWADYLERLSFIDMGNGNNMKYTTFA